ncbi:MAG: hypothetical protein JWL76_2056 [Thermoleophilia bacterium]|nr:hypothetical protein [Thermoleophilia bacterium]
MDLESIAGIQNVDGRIAALAALSGDVVANWQLREIGVSRWMVSRRVRDGVMRPVGAQEFVVGPGATRAFDDRMRRGLAVVHGGPGAVALARGTASAKLDLLDRGDGTIHVASDRHVRDLPAHRIAYHRSSMLSADDIISCAGEPTTHPSLTIVELGHDHTRYQFVRAMCAARDRDRFDQAKVTELLRERRGFPGSREVRMALQLLADGCNGTRGRAEDLLVAGVLHSRLLPAPDVCNRRKLGIAGIEPDLAWPKVGLVVFADGRPHSWEDIREKDAQEMVTLREHGITVLRFDNRRIWNRLPAVIADIEFAYHECRRTRLRARRRKHASPMSQALR